MILNCSPRPVAPGSIVALASTTIPIPDSGSSTLDPGWICDCVCPMTANAGIISRSASAVRLPKSWSAGPTCSIAPSMCRMMTAAHAGSACVRSRTSCTSRFSVAWQSVPSINAKTAPTIRTLSVSVNTAPPSVLLPPPLQSSSIPPSIPPPELVDDLVAARIRDGDGGSSSSPTPCAEFSGSTSSKVLTAAILAAVLPDLIMPSIKSIHASPLNCAFI